MVLIISDKPAHLHLKSAIWIARIIVNSYL